MLRSAAVLLCAIFLTPAAAVAQTCNPPAANSITPTDSSLTDWSGSNMCLWQGTDPVDNALQAGQDILGFAVTHSPTIGGDATMNHFWFMRLRGAPIANNEYRLSFAQPGGNVVDMDMTCPGGTTSPQTCSINCHLNGNPATCATTYVRAYSLNGQWIIELARHSTQLFFDSTDSSTITASVLRNSRVYDTTAGVPDYHSNGYVGATAVTLRSFTVRSEGRGAEIVWETAAEQGTLGFFVRRGGKDGPRVNRELVPGQLTSPVGASYRVFDPSGSASDLYFLEELALEGQFFYGPAQRTLRTFTPAPQLQATAFSAHGSGRGSSGPPPNRHARADSAFAEVTQQGLYTFSISEVETLLSGPAHDLRASTGGREVSLFRTGSDYLFYAGTPGSPERTFDAYHLEPSRPAHRASRDQATRPRGHVPAPTSFLSTVHAGGHVVQDASATDPALRFLWGACISVSAPPRFAVDLPDHVGGAVQLDLTLVGMMDAPHHASVTVNGQAIMDAQFGGRGPVSYRLTVPAGVMQAGSNTVELSCVAAPGTAYDIVGLASIDATFSRAYVARNDALEFTADASAPVQVVGFSAKPALFDVTDPERAVLVEGARLLATSSGAGLSFQRTHHVRGVRRYFAAVPGKPVLRASRSAEVPPGTADYVAVVGEGLGDPLQPLLAKRRADGRTVMSVPVKAIYDAFGHGHPGTEPIHAFLASLAPTLRDVLLVGKPTIDPNDYLRTGVPDLVPTPLVVSGNLRVYSPADVLLVAGEDGRTPFAAIGRLPVRTDAELSAWVAKILAYEQSSPPASSLAVFAADGTDPRSGAPDPYFQQLSDAAAARLAPGFTPRKVYLPAQAKADLMAALAAGPTLVSYHGHGGGVNWAPKMLTASDVPSLPAARPFFLVTVDCWDGLFAMPSFVPVSQAVAQAPQGGAIAAFAPGSLVDRTHDPLVDDILYTHLSDPAVTTVGEFARRSQAQLASLVGPAKDLVFVYNLIGDPATRLPFR